jgi:hypothetical protein
MLRQLHKSQDIQVNPDIKVLVEDFETSLDKNGIAKSDDVTRDYMGEMILACQLMITGGEKKEIAAITRQDRLYIVEALIKAAKDAELKDYSQMIASDVVFAFREIAAGLQGNQNEINKVTRLKKWQIA